MTTEHIPGPRQTVDRCCHPTLGEGVAVYDNGPAWFRADSGEVVPMKSIDVGGWSRSEGSWLVAVQPDGSKVNLATTGRKRGERHNRVVADLLGPGWLVGLSGQMRRWRFEPDGGGKSIEMEVVQMFVGKPSDLTKNGDRRAKIPTSHERWTTLQTRSGSFFVYQREEDYVPNVPVEAPRSAVEQAEQLGLPL